VLKQGRVAYEGEARRIAMRLLDDEESNELVGEELLLEAAHIKRQREPIRARRVETAERVRFDSVSFGYDRAPLLSDINLQVMAGERVGIAGKNGSGKSTLLLLAGGALAAASGRIRRTLSEHGVVYLPQSPERLFFAESVMEEITFGLERRGIARDAARQRAEEALYRVGLDAATFAHRSPFELSFGEMRRVAFAIAWALEPELLLLDEPASCLDARGRAVFERLVANAAERGAAVMIASHEEMSPSSVDRVLDLVEGTLAPRPTALTRPD
jgi:energy-coupling factor transporter ATP-binding protein EcfA2